MDINKYLALKPRPDIHFAHAPYKAELFSPETGWSGVMNRNGINCLTFELSKGCVIASYEVCEYLANIWNMDK